MAKAQPKSPAKGRTKAEQRAVSRELILDAAEELFAAYGLFGVTIRDVAAKSGVDPALVHYYFGNKQTLFDEVFSRRASISVQLRSAALDRYEADHPDGPSVEGALHAFLDTEFDTYIEGGPAWRNFGSLAAQISNTPNWGADKMDEHFDPVVKRLIALIAKALPGCSHEDVFWSYHFVSGAIMLSLSRTGRIDRLSDGVCRSDDFPAIKARMAEFMAAGFHRICRPGVSEVPGVHDAETEGDARRNSGAIPRSKRGSRRAPVITGGS